MSRALTHGQYEELVTYEHGRPSWRLGGPPSSSLTVNGFLIREPHSGHDRANSMFRITNAGLGKLAEYRAKWGIREPVEA